jgi:general secretion pathway protein J
MGSKNEHHFRQSGFTLLEVLIAITITALIGLGAWQLLNSAIRTYEISQASLQSLSQVQRAQLHLERDFRQVLPRAIRDEFGDYQPALSSRDNFFTVELTRQGWRNPLQEPRSELQRVAYELLDGVLYRRYWQVLDRAQDSEPRSQRLLSDVTEFSVAFLNDSNAWVDEWPPDTDEDQSDDRLLKYAQLPRAVRVSMTHPKYGEIPRIFELPQYQENILIQAPDNGQGGSDNGQNNDQNSGLGNSGQGTVGPGNDQTGGVNP